MKNGKEVVVITGASAGLGRAIAHEFARHGAALALVARGQERLEATRREVEELGGTALVLPADVADAPRIDAIADEVERTLGPIDIWINNAAASVFSPFHEITPDEFRRVTEVTYHGYVFGTMAALKRMRARDRGVIVQVGSTLADRSIPLQAAYCGAKHAIRGFTDSIRCELAHDRSHVHITMVQLPGMNTPQFDWCKSRLPHKAQPVPPIYQPEVGARAIYWAAHHRKRELYVGAPTVEAMWGNKVAAGALDRYLGRTGYQAQQTDELENPNRPDNLWQPAPGDFGAHGRFDRRSRRRSYQLSFAKHSGWAWGALGVGAAVLAAVAGVRGRRR